MGKYRVKQLERRGTPPQDYHYGIWRGDELVADYFHDFRNDERWFVIGGVRHNVTSNELPISRDRWQPCHVTPAGEALLDAFLTV
jgi:hypothetical protein